MFAGGPNPNPAELAGQFEQVRAGSLVGLSVPLIGVLANSDSRTGALPNLGARADDLFGAPARDRTAHFLAGHPELVWPLYQ
ncbi:MAG TPA: hypothetical protein VFX70_07055 [Mycobacteriales bacterium]|nr:hypothetical protein [Mycobacteriales bacterium]